MDWMGDIGGLSRAIMVILIGCFGQASNYCQKIEMMLHFYSKNSLFKILGPNDQTEMLFENEGGDGEAGSEYSGGATSLWYSIWLVARRSGDLNLVPSLDRLGCMLGSF